MKTFRLRAARRAFAIVLLSVFATAFCLMPQEARAAGNFIIKDYDVQVVVNEDDTYDITETISVEFTAQSHGIYRTILLQTRLDRDGQQSMYYGKVKDFSVMSGYPLIYGDPDSMRYEYVEWEDESEDGVFCARIGDPDAYAPQYLTYKMNYTFDTKGDHFKDGDEFFYNLIGTSWEAKSIDHVSFDVQFPKAIDMSKVGIKTGNNDMVSFKAVSDTEISGETTDYVMNGLTMRAVLPEGYFSRQAKEPSNTLLYIITGLMLLLAAAGFFLWRRYGVDPRVVETEEFYPPEKLSAPEVGYLSEGEISGNHVISMLLSLADKGYLKIVETDVPAGIRKKKTKSTYEIAKVRDYDGDVIGEGTFMEGLFGDGDTVTIDDLKNKFYKTVSTIRGAILKRYKGKLYDKKAERFSKLMLAGGCFGILALVGVATFVGADIRDIGGGSVLGPLYVAVMAAAVMVTGFVGISNKLNDHQHYFKIIIYVILVAVGLGMSYFFEVAPGILFIPFLIGIGASFVLFLLSGACRRKTDWYVDVLGKIRGYKNFLQVAEKDRMEMLAEQDPQYFYKNLAFAFALGVTAVYAKNFAALATQPPEWYQSTHVYAGSNPVTSASFLDSVDSMMNSISTNMTSSPSGGSGGGSFSGGGGAGGGGGGSW